MILHVIRLSRNFASESYNGPDHSYDGVTVPMEIFCEIHWKSWDSSKRTCLYRGKKRCTDV